MELMAELDGGAIQFSEASSVISPRGQLLPLVLFHWQLLSFSEYWKPIIERY